MIRVTLLTDFGTVDGYVAAMKGTLVSACPAAVVEDVSHAVEPGDVRQGAHTLARYWRRYPPGTVHIVVVDPGVGTERRAIAAHVDGRFLVGPDNGVFSIALDNAVNQRVVELEIESFKHVSATFHGRDVFAPAAARLACGHLLEDLGRPAGDVIRLLEPEPRTDDGGAFGEIVAVDHFGNLITNLGAEHLRGGAAVRVGGLQVPVRRTYGEAKRGAVLALLGSEGRLEIAVRDGSAAGVLGLGRGAEVVVVR